MLDMTYDYTCPYCKIVSKKPVHFAFEPPVKKEVVTCTFCGRDGVAEIKLVPHVIERALFDEAEKYAHENQTVRPEQDSPATPPR